MAHKVVARLKQDDGTYIERGTEVSEGDVGGEEIFDQLVESRSVVTDEEFTALFPGAVKLNPQLWGSPSNIDQMDLPDRPVSPEVKGPVITSIEPNTGDVAGGTEVTIVGENLTGTTGVAFGDNDGNNLEVQSDTEVVVDSPAGEEGVVTVVLTTAVGTATVEEGFTYTDAGGQ